MNFNVINYLGADMKTTDIILWVVLGVLVVGLLVFPMLTRRRQMKDFNQMLGNLSVGDKIMTTTGMIGTIRKINRKEDGVTFLLETGEKTVIEFDVGAIARVLHSVNPIPVVEKGNKKKEEQKTAEAETVETTENDDNVLKKEETKVPAKKTNKKNK